MPDSESRVLFDRVQSQSPSRQQQARENIGISGLPISGVATSGAFFEGNGTQDDPLRVRQTAFFPSNLASVSGSRQVDLDGYNGMSHSDNGGEAGFEYTVSFYNSKDAEVHHRLEGETTDKVFSLTSVYSTVSDNSANWGGGAVRMPTAYGSDWRAQEWTFPYALNSNGTTIFTIPVSAASLAHVHIEFGLYNNDFTGLAPWVGLNDLRTNVITPGGTIIGADHDMDCFVDTAQPAFANTRFSIDFGFRANETGNYQVQWRTPEVSYAANSFRMNNMHWNWWY